MQTKPVLTPGPDHPITVTPNPARIVITVAGRVIADTHHALTLQEANYPAVQYIPREDADTQALSERFARWHAETLDLPGVFYLEAVDKIFRENRLAKGTFVALGRELRLSKLTMPVAAIPPMVTSAVPPLIPSTLPGVASTSTRVSPG